MFSPMNSTRVETVDEFEEHSADEGWSWQKDASWNSSSPPVDRAIHSFNEELQNVSKSIDDLLSVDHRPRPSTNYSPRRTTNDASIKMFQRSERSARKNISSGRKDPSSSSRRMSPLQPTNSSHANSPSRRLYNVSSATTTPAPLRPRSENPPTPVETPMVDRFHGLRGRHLDGIPEEIGTKDSIRLSSGQKQTWASALDVMDSVLRKQQQEIDDLKKDNSDLKQQLKINEQQQRILESSTHNNRNSRTPNGYTRSHTHEPISSPPPVQQRYAQDRRSTPPHRTSQRSRSRSSTSRVDGPFSPGTCFVADLAKLTKLEEGHHAPLSVILDKHWDKLRRHFEREDY